MTGGAQGARLRAAAARAVDGVVSAGRSLDASLADAESTVAEADRPLLRLMAYGTLRHYWRLQGWLGMLMDRPLRARDSVVGALLAVGLYQLSETRVPDHAAVSETVAATRFVGRPRLAGFVNAVLRRALRERVVDERPPGEEAACNHPQWLIDTLRSDWPGNWEAIAAANNDRAPMWLRVNAAQGTTAAYRDELAAHGIAADGLAAAPAALRLAEPVAVDKLPGFAEGRVSVQDAAAQLAAPWLLDGLTGGRILDACAAPGGKSGHLLELGGDRVDLTCIDNDTTRLGRVAENLQRLRLDATLLHADASNPQEWWQKEAFDAILLDAPCSGTGVIRRHPDIKHLRRPGDIPAMAELQSKLLRALWPLLAPGGRLLYVTCSVLAEENDAVAGRFVEAQADATENTVLHNNNIRDLMCRKACGFQVLPGTAGLDGFYFACLEKVS